MVPLRYFLVRIHLRKAGAITCITCRMCTRKNAYLPVEICALAPLSRKTAPSTGKTHAQTPLKYDHWKPGRPDTKLLYGPHEKKQHRLNILKANRRRNKGLLPASQGTTPKKDAGSLPSSRP